MRRRDLIAATAVLAASASAASANEGRPAAAVGQYVDLSPVAVPALDGRRLKNYIFVAVRLNLTARADPQKLRDREPYFRDAMVRAVHRAAYNPPGEFSKVDVARFRTMMMTEATRVAGPGMIGQVVITSQQPQHRTAR
jgi:hypothetical protein